MKPFALAVLLAVLAAPSLADERAEPWDAWIERDFPFFSTVVDARKAGIPSNLTPRAIVFPLGDTYVAFDVDLLRVSAIWTTDGVPFDQAGMAVHSYPDRFDKVHQGQNNLPKPRGDVWIQNGIYPGASLDEPRLKDPRPQHPMHPYEVGRGAMTPALGALHAVRYDHGGTLDYSVGPVGVSERFEASPAGVTRVITVQPHDRKLVFTLAAGAPEITVAGDGCRIADHEEHRVLEVDPADERRTFRVTYTRKLTDPAKPTSDAKRRWPESVELEIKPFAFTEGQVTALEELPLPGGNPWKRSVRAASVDFFPDGRAAVVTFDGDVWLSSPLAPDARSITWRRYASGLHEPLSIAIHDGAIYTFDRNGIWRIVDADGNGEADRHELVCNLFDQTAETREFASDLRITPDGSFIICKPGQSGSTVAPSSGAILRIPPDGSKFERVAYGLRQPFLGYDEKTGRLVVSDQQGNYVPSTPVYEVERGAYYGYLTPYEKGYPQEITPPLTWIPHHVCGSAAALHWLRGEQYGHLDGACMLLSFTRPGLLQIYADEADGVRQGGAARLPMDPDFALHKGAINPADGMFYVTGFKIWGSTAERVSALARLRINRDAVWPLPTQVIAAKRGVYLKFAAELDPNIASVLTRYAVDRWNYERTSKYGSPNLRLDGSHGVDKMPVSQVKLSKDRRAIFIGLPDMIAAMQISVGYHLETPGGDRLKDEVFLTAHRLRRLDLTKLGFADNDVDLSGGVLADTVEEASVEIGKSLHANFGCAACHSLDGTTQGKTGPSWKGLFESQRKLVAGGPTVVADAAYLRESILDPSAKVAEGAVNGEAGMPAYKGVLSDTQVESLIMFIRSLKAE